MSSGIFWDFGDAFDALGVSDLRRRKLCKELSLICQLYWLTVKGEKQETPARKAEAFKKARRQYPKRQRALKQLEKARKLRAKGNVNGAERIEKKANRTLQHPWLPAALEYEAARLQLNGTDPVQSFIELDKRYRQQSRGGNEQSFALIQTVHRLQGFASKVDEKLTWRSRNIPPKLISFVIAVLNAASIKHPNFEDNPSKFRLLMIKSNPSQQHIPQGVENPVSWLKSPLARRRKAK
jgi:hypothetical protein